MKLEKIKYIILLGILFNLILCTKSYAKIIVNDKSINSGQTVKITVTSQEEVASGAIDIISNDGLIFKNVTGDGLSNGTLFAFANGENIQGIITTYEFIAPKVSEDTKFSVKFCSKDMANAIGEQIESSNAIAIVTVKVNEKDKEIQLGDINKDGKVNALDGTLILKYVSKKKMLTDEQISLADVNKDGKINSLDAVKILKYVAKKITKF